MSQGTFAKRFNTILEAEQWMLSVIETVGGVQVYNHRFAFIDDDPAMSRYWQQHAHGRNASFDEQVYIRGHEGLVGCNYNPPERKGPHANTV